MKKTYAKTVKRVFSAFLAVSLLTSNVNLGGLFKNMSVTAFGRRQQTPMCCINVILPRERTFRVGR